MPDQIADRYTAGIPHDVVRARAEVEQFRNEAEYHASRAQFYDESARSSADSAAVSAARAQEYAERQVDAVSVGPEAPGYENRWDGKVWMKTVGTNVTNVLVWDTSMPGNALMPDVDLLPDADLMPDASGGWKEYGIA